MMDFSKISEKARPNVALMVNFVEFSKISLNSNHNTTESNSVTDKIELLVKFHWKLWQIYELV